MARELFKHNFFELGTSHTVTLFIDYRKWYWASTGHFSSRKTFINLFYKKVKEAIVSLLERIAETVVLKNFVS